MDGSVELSCALRVSLAGSLLMAAAVVWPAVCWTSVGSSRGFSTPGRQLGAIQPIRSVEEIVALLGPPPYSYRYKEADCPRCNRAIWDPVCGSDYRTHANGECLRRLACRRKRNISVEHLGPCTHKSAILGRSPRSVTRTNAREKLRGPELVPVICTPCTHNLYQPLCGSDGRTYPNWMCLRHQACKQRKNIQVINPGPCGVGFLKGPYKQTANFFTGIQSHAPECLECNSSVGKPVCGSDGRTYANEKCLKAAACQNEVKNVRTVAPGPCKFTFTANPTTPTKKNLTDSSITIECPATCSDLEKFICASDGITYPNECLMRMEACLFKKALQVTLERKCAEDELEDDDDDDDDNGNGADSDGDGADGTDDDNNNNNGGSGRDRNDRKLGAEDVPKPPERATITDGRDGDGDGDEDGDEEEDGGEEGDKVTTAVKDGGVGGKRKSSARTTTSTTTTTTTAAPSTTTPDPEDVKHQKRRQQREQKRQQQSGAKSSSGGGNRRKHKSRGWRHQNKNKKHQHQNRQSRSSDGVCPVCTRHLDWVCGNDGFTYINPCSLRHESCVRRKPIFVRRPGRC